MAVDLTLVKKAVTANVNAAAKNADGSALYTLTVADDRRSMSEISDKCDEAALMVLQAIAETEGNPHRSLLMNDSASIASGALIPDHIGPIGIPKIQRFAGDAYRAGHPARIDDIEAWRADSAALIYAEKAYDQQGSPLAGYYNVMANELRYTGVDATVPIATLARAQIFIVPDEYEAVVIALATALCFKEGDPSGVAMYFQQLGMSGLQLIRGGAMVIPPVVEVQKAQG